MLFFPSCSAKAFGVHPIASFLFTFAPLSSRILTISRCPLQTATWRAVWPSSAAEFASIPHPVDSWALSALLFFVASDPSKPMSLASCIDGSPCGDWSWHPAWERLPPVGTPSIHSLRMDSGSICGSVKPELSSPFSFCKKNTAESELKIGIKLIKALSCSIDCYYLSSTWKRLFIIICPSSIFAWIAFINEVLLNLSIWESSEVRTVNDCGL